MSACKRNAFESRRRLVYKQNYIITQDPVRIVKAPFGYIMIFQDLGVKIVEALWCRAKGSPCMSEDFG